MKTQPDVNDPAKAKMFFDQKNAFTCGPVDVFEWRKGNADINIIDVRAADDYVKGHVPGAVNIPKDKWETTEELGRDKLNIVYCYSYDCHLAARAARLFADKGYPVMEMDGGSKAWRDHDFEMEGGAAKATSMNAAMTNESTMATSQKH